MGIKIIAVFLTILLGFIGTFIVRFAIVKHDLGKAAVPTLIHFLLNAAIIIPIIGSIIALIGTIYFAWTNFKLAK